MSRGGGGVVRGVVRLGVGRGYVCVELVGVVMGVVRYVQLWWGRG